MKFPYNLSEQRISLLSKEDQLLYEYEHSDFYDKGLREYAMKEFQKAVLERQGYYVQQLKSDQKFSYLNESELNETGRELAIYEAEKTIDELADFIEEAVASGYYSEQEATEYLKELVENLNNINSSNLAQYQENSLNEIDALNEDTDGPDMTWWMNGLGGMFTGFFGIILALIMRGKTKMAIRMLENSMNKIVEKVDDGVNKSKGRGLFARIKTGLGKLFGKDWSGKNEGEQNTMCLRVLQENFQADTATKAMVFCKKAGILNSQWATAVADLRANRFTNGSFEDFTVNVAEPVNQLCNMKSKK